MKFLIDMPLSPNLSEELRQEGHDSVHVIQLQMRTSSDLEIIQRALKERRIVVTADLDYPRLFASLQLRSPGLVLFRGGNFSEEESRLLFKEMLKKVDEETVKDSVIILEKTRIRVRKLPIE